MSLRTARPSDFAAITEVWHASVSATHDFLPRAYIGELRPRILHEWLPAVGVTVYTDAGGHILGFSGVAEAKLEMLFVLPSARGQGVGKALLDHAVAHQGVRQVDVNEQNDQAVGFYRHAGFAVIGRSA